MKRIDLTGKRIAKILVLNYSHSHIQPSGQKRAMWNVKCDCGIEKKMSTSTLSNKKLRSCGCEAHRLRKLGFNKLAPGEANFNRIYLQYIHRAKNKKIPFELDKAFFREIITKRCVYCNSEGDSFRVNRSHSNGLFISNGIDRVDSSKGYTKENSVACCKTCNVMKNSLTLEKFLNHIKKIYYVSIDQGLLI
ncbi:hypothetical protein [Flavobacterium sp.]|uniref:hypothetical protein n=1 Tax=Flavobacterium sp. TaxID=239 RepID=UPI0025E6B26D|nr:hypothetical protein [Flavobacterium sp.]